MKKRGRPIILVGLFLVLTIVIYNSFVLVSSSDDVSKSYNSDTKTVTITDSSNNDILTVSLIENSDHCFVNCYAIMKVELKKDLKISNLVSNLDFQKFTDKGFINISLLGK